MKKQVSTYPLRLPASLKAAVVEVSRVDGTSINQFVATAVAEKLSALKTAEFFTDRAAKRTSRRRAACCGVTGGSRQRPKTAFRRGWRGVRSGPFRSPPAASGLRAT